MSGGETFRSKRISELVYEKLRYLFSYELQDPRVSQVRVTKVTLSPDMRQAKVLYLCELNDEVTLKAVKQGLVAASHFLQKKIAKDLSLRVTPKLTFYYDEALLKMERLQEAIKDIEDEDPTESE